MKGKAALLLGLSLGVAMNVSAGEDKKGHRLDRWYPPPFYVHRATETKEPGVHRLKLDNRTLEITLPAPPPDEFFMPEAVASKGENEAFAKRLKREQRYSLACFSAAWNHTLPHDWLELFARDHDGHIGASLEVKQHTRTWIKDPTAKTVVGTSGVIEGERPIDLDYFKLEDFIHSVRVDPHGNVSPNPYRVETINGRRWVREMRKLDEFGREQGERWYRETFYTPVDRLRILRVSIEVSDDVLRYATPEDMPRWLREASRNITAVLRSIKLSPPDDGSPDPFLLDPEQKPEAVPIEFPGWRR